MADMKWTTYPLAASFGAEVRGLELHALDPGTASALRALLYEHKVLLFRRQSLSDAELERLAGQLGTLQTTNRTGQASTRHVATLSNLKDEHGEWIGGLGGDELAWHTDLAYRAKPATLSINAMLLPSTRGGETAFCDMVQGWQALPADLQQRARGLTGLYAANPNANRTDKGVTCHSLVLPHPTGGRVSLYLSERSKELGLEGLEPAQSTALIDAYLHYQLRPAHCYTHRWLPGDVVMWDGGQTLHRREAVHGPRLAKAVRAHLPAADFAVPAGRWEDRDPASFPHWYFNHGGNAHFRA